MLGANTCSHPLNRERSDGGGGRGWTVEVPDLNERYIQKLMLRRTCASDCMDSITGMPVHVSVKDEWRVNVRYKNTRRQLA